jgi:hypothetical protein
MDFLRGKVASLSSEEPVELSFKRGEVHAELVVRSKAPSQAPKSSGAYRRPVAGSKTLSANEKAGDHIQPRSPLRRVATPRGHEAPPQRPLRPRGAWWSERRQTVGSSIETISIPATRSCAPRSA